MTVIFTVLAALGFAAVVGTVAGRLADRRINGDGSWPVWDDVPRHCVQCGRPVPYDDVEDLPGFGRVDVRYLPVPVVCHQPPRVAGWACSPPCVSAWKARHHSIYHS